MSDQIQITVNGKDRIVAANSTINDLLANLQLAPEKVAVECNKNIVKKSGYDTSTLHDGDRLEIVTFVGGG
ncbi:sulfur carrier protein ThiS [Planctomycetota bacterium]